jgi:YD repeat-containing protein
VLFNDGSATSYTLKPKGVIIEGWQRIEEVVDIPLTATSMNVYLETATSTTAYFDDIRMQPFNANMKSFVYDPVNLRLVAELDENNHATFYEYDDEGTLIRLKKETERGIKTIKETRSALSKPLNP